MWKPAPRTQNWIIGTDELVAAERRGLKMELKGGKLETKEQEEVFQNLSLC